MKTSDFLTQDDKMVIEGQRRRNFDDPHGQALLRLYHAGKLDDTTRAMLYGRVERCMRRQGMSGSPFDIPQLYEGDHIFGLGMDVRPLLTFLQFRNGHSLTISGSGGGKTTKSIFDAMQILVHVLGAWLMDMRKREFRKLIGPMAKRGVTIQVVPAHQMKFNIFQVPLGVDARQWAAQLADLLIEVLGLPGRASKLIQTTIHRLYHQRGIFQGSENFPTLFELRDAIAHDSEANPQARLAIVDTLDPLLVSMGPVFAYRKGWSSHDLARLRLIFEFGGIPESAKNLLLNALLMAEFTSRIARGISNPQLSLWICCDEARRLCSSTGQGGTPGPLDDSIGLIRGSGIAFDAAVQSASDLSPNILSNTAIKCVGRCGSAADYELIGRCMGLTAEQIQWCQFNLTPGLFVGQLGDGDWRYPFLFRIPKDPDRFFADLPNQQALPIDDGDINKVDDVWDLPTVPAPEFLHGLETPPVLDTTVPTANTTPSPDGFDESEIRFLKAVVEKPGLISSAYVKLAGLGARKAKIIRERLAMDGFLRVDAVATGKRGRNSLILHPTEKALKDFAVPAKEG
jgi:hypothetical protein